MTITVALGSAVNRVAMVLQASPLSHCTFDLGATPDALRLDFDDGLSVEVVVRILPMSEIAS
jgi:hypothetical protein